MMNNLNTNQYQPAMVNRPLYQQQQNNLRIRPVSSLEEVRAAGVDFDGSVFFFPDFANKRIYTKAINVDGTAILNMYELKELPKPETMNYVTREEFNSTLEEIKTALIRINSSTQTQDQFVAKEPIANPMPQQQKTSILDF